MRVHFVGGIGHEKLDTSGILERLDASRNFVFYELPDCCLGLLCYPCELEPHAGLLKRSFPERVAVKHYGLRGNAVASDDHLDL